MSKIFTPASPKRLLAGYVSSLMQNNKRGRFLLFAKGGQEGFSFQCLHNYDLADTVAT